MAKAKEDIVVCAHEWEEITAKPAWIEFETRLQHMCNVCQEENVSMTSDNVDTYKIVINSNRYALLKELMRFPYRKIAEGKEALKSD